MRRILVSMLLMFTAAVTWAQRWTAPGDNEYVGSSPLYLRITLNGEPINGNSNVSMEVAAFIGNNCRATTSTLVHRTANNGSFEGYELRVWGNPAKDNGQPITVDLTMETLTGIQRDAAADSPIEVSLPGTYDMSGLVKLLFGANQIEENQVKDSSTGEPLVSNHQRIDLQGYTVNISRPEVPVTSIACDIQELTVYQYQDVRNALDQHITISPDDATDKTWYIVDNNIYRAN